MATALKLALEELLRTRRLVEDAPPLRGDARHPPIVTGLPALDGLLPGGFPRGQVSEIHGPASSGRTGVALALMARLTGAGALGAWVDPWDRLDPATAAASGVDLTRLLWLRGAPDPRPDRPASPLARALAAVATLVASGLFSTVVLDMVGGDAPAESRLPGTTWLRLDRTVEDTATALVLLARAHLARGPRGVSLALARSVPRFVGAGPGRLLSGLSAEARRAPSLRGVPFELQA